MAECYQWRNEDLILNIRLQPRASKDEIVGLHGDRLKIRITAPPVDGKANEHLCHFLARQFKVPKSAVSLLTGHSGREKRILIHSPSQLPPTVADLQKSST